MAIEIRCPGCSRTLRVPDEHAGKQVRCPACQQISIAPGAGAAAGAAGGGVAGEDAAAQAAASDSQTWHLRTPNGPTYGPITWPQLRQWAAEGRVSSNCQLAEDSDGRWRPATDFFPGLPTAPAPAPAPSPTTYPWSAQQAAEMSGGGRGYANPHRGGLILVLGLLGFMMTCPIFSLMAWVMGSHDLAEMRAGRMDRSGEGLTQAGQILGMILSVICVIGCGITLFIFLFAAVAGNF